MFNYYGNSKEDFKKIKSLIESSDQHNLKLSSFLVCIVLFILSLVSTFLPFATQFKEVYFIFTFLFFIFNILIRTIKVHHRIWIYILIILLFSLSTALTLLIPNQPATIFPIMLMIIPLLFTMTFYSLSALCLLSSWTYMFLIHFLKDPAMAQFDTYNIMVLLIISLNTRYLIQKNNVAGMLLKVENQRLVDKLNYDAHHDSLTNLLNRKAFVNNIVDVKQAVIKSDYTVLGILDVDSFKHINDTYGHQQGDWVLLEISSILKRCFTETDIVGRLGGDEFIFCLANRTHLETIIQEIEHVIKEINNITINEVEGIGTSIGIVYFPENRLTFMEAYKKADFTLYEAKSTGKNKVRVYY